MFIRVAICFLNGTLQEVCQFRRMSVWRSDSAIHAWHGGSILICSASPMTLPRTIFFVLLLAAFWCSSSGFAQGQGEWVIESLNDNGWVEFDTETHIATATNGVLVRYGGGVLTAQSATINQATSEVLADGNVRIQQGDLIWASDHLRYNFNTRQIVSEQFRTGKNPVFAAGYGLHADISNSVYVATNAYVTSEDTTHPFMRVRAKSIKIIPGQRIEAHGATVYVGKVPVFYFPWYSRDLTGTGPKFMATPGYRSLYGGFLLGRYNSILNEQLDGVIHVDYRTRRGVGVGPDANYDLGRWGAGTFSYYYLHDQDPNANAEHDLPLPDNRQRVNFSYLASPITNLEVRSVVRYESDWSVVRDYFTREYRRDPQPSSFLEVNKFWSNFSLDAYAQPQVNEFLETVERLPDIRLTGFRQQLGETPVYYESESSAGYYRRSFAENAGTNGAPPGLDYEAARADSYHQLLLPYTFMGWLNVTPRVGGRFTYYSRATGPGATTDEIYRGVFNTGAEVSFKVSRTWAGFESRFFDMDGLRHIFEPSVNYVFVPQPNYRPPELPQFDYRFPSLRLLPIEFPDYNAIDAVDSANVFRLGMRNRVQTKREGAVANVLSWDLYTDWRVHPESGQSSFDGIYSDISFKPRAWLTLESLTQFDIDAGNWRVALHTITIQPNSKWSWGLGHWFVRDQAPFPIGLGQGNNLFINTILYKFDENWAFRTSQHFEARDGRMEEQDYTFYRDLRSWTTALSFIIRQNQNGPTDYTVAFTFSLKAFPRYGVNADNVRAFGLLGGS